MMLALASAKKSPIAAYYTEVNKNGIEETKTLTPDEMYFFQQLPPSCNTPHISITYFLEVTLTFASNQPCPVLKTISQ